MVGQGAYIDNISSGTDVTYFNIPVTNQEDTSFNYSVPKDQIDAYAYTNSEHKVTSIFSRLTYNYKEKYLLTGIIRRDGSSRFGSDNKYGVFPSFSLGWVPSKEIFWTNNNVVNQLKIRGGLANSTAPDYGNYPPPSDDLNAGSTAFHEYGIDWYHDRIEFFADDNVYHIHYLNDGGVFTTDGQDQISVTNINNKRVSVSEYFNHFEEWHPFENKMYAILSAGVGGQQYTYGGPIVPEAVSLYRLG